MNNCSPWIHEIYQGIFEICTDLGILVVNAKYAQKYTVGFLHSAVHSKGVFFCHQTLRLYTWLQQNASMQLKFALVMPKY